jgi:hypothetical protein
VLTTLLPVAACTSPNEPRRIGNAFVLRSIDGVALPALWAQGENVTARMTSATLTLRDDGTGTWHAVIEETPGGTTIPFDDDLTYVLDGTNIELTYVCNDVLAPFLSGSMGSGADCIAGPHLVGVMTPLGLTITASLVTRAPMVFESVPASTSGRPHRG